MNRDEAVDLVRQYQEFCRAAGVPDPTLRDIADRWPEDGSERKAMRWLGFMQGALYAMGLLSLDDIKAQSRDRDVPLPEPRATECKSVVPDGAASPPDRVVLYAGTKDGRLRVGDYWSNTYPVEYVLARTTECRSVSRKTAQVLLRLLKDGSEWGEEELLAAVEMHQVLGAGMPGSHSANLNVPHPGNAQATDCGSVARKEGE